MEKKKRVGLRKGIIWVAVPALLSLLWFWQSTFSSRLSAQELKDAGYESARATFMNAKVGDGPAGGYAKAIQDLEKVSRESKNPAVKVRCLVLVSFARFLDGDDLTEISRTGPETVSLAKESGLNTDLLDNVLNAIKNKSAKEFSDLQFLFSGEKKEVLLFVEDLRTIQKKREDYQSLRKKCWNSYYQPRFNQRMEQMAVELRKSEVSEAQIAGTRKSLADQVEQKGFYISQVLENEISQATIKFIF